MLLIPLNKALKEPLYKQIVHKISHMIASGKLKEDDVLPTHTTAGKHTSSQPADCRTGV